MESAPVAAKTILVKNNEARVHGLAMPGKPGEVLTLKPGVNEIDAALWAKVSTDEINKWRLSPGSLSKGVAVFEVVARDAKRGPTEALIAETFDRDLLKRWLESASGNLVAAIQAQLARISPSSDERAVNEAFEPERARERVSRGDK